MVLVFKMYTNAFFKINDPNSTSVANIPIHSSWWSRQYEYPWAFEFAKPGLTVADMGCGYTYRPFKNMLATVCKKVYAVDSRKEALSIKIAEKNIDFVLADFTKPLTTKIPTKLDHIFCLSVLEEGVNLQKALEQFKKLLKADGLIILTFDVIANPDKPVGKYQGVNLDKFFKAVKKVNLKVVGGMDFSLERRLTHPEWNLSPFHCVLCRADYPYKFKHHQKTSSVLRWVKKNYIKGNGIASWPGYSAYPEVTGYLIPTLLSHGEVNLARKLANWLVKVQDKSGGFLGLDGKLRSFDTAAALRGLEIAVGYFSDKELAKAVDSAGKWIVENTLSEDGQIFSQPDKKELCNYSLRVNGILDIKARWIDNRNPSWPFLSHADRSHYIAYALEGFLALGLDSEAKKVLANVEKGVIGPGFIAYQVGENWTPQAKYACYTATAQVGLLLTRLGIKSELQKTFLGNLFNALDKNGGLPARNGSMATSWTAKWLLDFEDAFFDAEVVNFLNQLSKYALQGT